MFGSFFIYHVMNSILRVMGQHSLSVVHKLIHSLIHQGRHPPICHLDPLDRFPPIEGAGRYLRRRKRYPYSQSNPSTPHLTPLLFLPAGHPHLERTGCEVQQEGGDHPYPPSSKPKFPELSSPHSPTHTQAEDAAEVSPPPEWRDNPAQRIKLKAGSGRSAS
jgi:hypothetical protein